MVEPAQQEQEVAPPQNPPQDGEAVQENQSTAASDMQSIDTSQSQPRQLTSEEMAQIQMKRHSIIQRALARVFEGDQGEADKYGFGNVQVQYYAIENVERWAPQILQTNGSLDPQSEEESLIVIDDSWLKLAQIMWTKDRKLGRNARKEDYQRRNGPAWAVKAKEHSAKRRQIFTRAGEVTCLMSGLSEDPILYFRDDDMPTILELMDPVQLFIPAPVLSNVNRAKVVDSLVNDKPRTVTILAEIMESSLDIMKSFEGALISAQMNADLVQPFQILLLEDILWTDFNIDFEDFKMTVMHHRLLNDQIFVNQIKDGIQQVQEYFQDKFPEQE